MATPDYYTCDKCGDRVTRDSRTFAATDTELDRAGDTDTVGERVDLCSRCWGSWFSAMNSGRRGLRQFLVGNDLLQWIAGPKCSK